METDATTVSELFLRFALAAGNDSDIETPGERVASLDRDGATLRLRWRREDARIDLSITHGPVGASQGSWLDLWDAPTDAGFVSPEAAGSFDDALDQGLALMTPEG